jgi:hypothetical protein
MVHPIGGFVMVSVTDLHKLLNDYLCNVIDRKEFTLRFFDSYARIEELTDPAVLGLSYAAHFPLADAACGLITEAELRDILSQIPLTTITVFDRDDSQSTPFRPVPAPPSSSPIEVEYEYA